MSQDVDPHRPTCCISRSSTNANLDKKADRCQPRESSSEAGQ
jgi:hypothetical protein